MRTIISLFLILLFSGHFNYSIAQTEFEEIEVPASNIVSLPFDALREKLQLATLESLTPLNEGGQTIDLPFPEGYTATFYVYESPIMATDYALQFPMIKTYSIYAVNNLAIRGRLTVTPLGIRGFILSPNGAYTIHPVDAQNPSLHIVSYGDDEISAPKSGQPTEFCGSDEISIRHEQQRKPATNTKSNNLSNGTNRRTYDVAIATTGEFYTSNCTTCTNANDVGVQSAIVNTINGIQVFYDRDLAIRFNLLTPVVFTNASTDPFTPAAANSSRTQLASDVITANFNTADYDIGHVLHDQNEGAGELRTGGVATLASVCSDQIIGGSVRKGRGWSSSFNNTSAGWLSLTAHEFAHMFDAPHTFNGNGDNCDGNNYSPGTAYEIGSGTTIMSYNGICGAAQNIPSAGSPTDDFFHAHSLDRIINYVNSVNCEDNLATGNIAPVASVGVSNAIPKGTPFTLTGSATDADGDELTYSWEQYDLSDPLGSTHGLIGSDAANNATAPLFRVFPPSPSPTRTFPEINQILSGDNGGAIFEPLPQVERTLNFRLNVRDNNPAGGGYHYTSLAVEVDGDAGPFVVTSPNSGFENWTAGSPVTISWDVAGTTAAPVSCANINISLSADGGENFYFPLALNTPNDGSETVTLSGNLPQTSEARIKIECANSGAVVFFDISDNNHTINSTCIANGGNICPPSAIIAPAGDASLNLNPQVIYGEATNEYVVALDETVAGSTKNQAGMNNETQTSCTSIDFRVFDVFTFTPDVSGIYTFARSSQQANSSSGASSFSYFSVYETNFVSNSTCTNFFASNATFLASTGQLSASGSINVNLTACQTYELVTWSNNATVTYAFSNPDDGQLLPIIDAPAGGYNYTYAALSTDADLIVQIDDNADFTDLCPGNYQIYGLSYKSSSTPPDIVNPNDVVGKSVNEAYSTNECLDFSDNFSTLNITGTPTLTATINADMTIICPSETVNFTSNVTGSPTSYEWTVAGESNPFATTANASNTFNTAGTFTVELLVSDGSCFATATQVITVEDGAAPTFTNCPTDITTNNDAGVCNAVVTWTPPTANDDCDSNPSVTSSHTPNSTFPVGTTTVTYTVTDAANKTATCSFDVTVNDNEDPVLNNCPSDITVNNDANSCNAVVNWTPPTATDNCDSNPMISGTHTAGSTFPVGTTTVTYTATDATGETTTCSFDITVNDNEDPVLNNCPTNITVNNDAGSCDAVVNWTPPTATDNCDNNPTISSSHTAGSTFPVGTTTVTYTATDAAGETATCSFDVTVNDNEDPVLNNCPSDITVNNDANSCAAIVSWTPPTATDNCDNNPTISSSHSSGSTFPVGTTTVTYTATDAAGKTATCSFDVTVNDNENPVLNNCPSDITINNDANSCDAIVNWTPPTATDNCDSNPTISSSHTAGSTFPVGTTTVTYTAMDAAGKTATCSFDVTVNDNENPVFSNCPADINKNNDAGMCSAVVNWTEPTISDNCDSDPTIFKTHSPNSTFPVGTTLVTYTATDDAGKTASCSFNVTIIDNENPVLTNCPSDIMVNNDAGSCDAVVNWTPPTVTDNCDSNPTVNSTHSPNSTFPVGTTAVIYTATDDAGKTASCSFNVTVIDNENPILTNCPTDITVNNDAGTCGAVVNWTPPTVTDNCDSNPTVNSTHNSGNTFPVGTTLVTYTATDNAGKTATCSFNVIVSDNENPVLSNCPSDITVNNDAATCGAVVNWAEPTITDNCDNAPTIFKTHTPESTFPVGTTTVTYTATDDAGKTTSCSFDVTVNDVEDPILMNCPMNMNVGNDASNCDAVVTWTPPTVSDNCTNNLTLTSTHNPGSTFAVGTTTTVTYTAMDNSGRTTTCSFDVTVNDNESPVFNNCPANIMVNNDSGNCNAAVTWTPPTVTDNCDSNPTVTSSHTSGSTFPVGITTVTYTATDNAGETATCSFNILVQDNENPTITCPNDITINTAPNNCDATVSWTVPTPNDNCGASITSSHTPNTTFPLGTTTVIYTATDAAMNSTTCSFIVTVQDDQLPVVDCQDFTLTLDQNDMATLTVSDVLVSTSDNCASEMDLINSASLSKTSFDQGDVGTQTITLSVNDGNGNTKVCNPTITVEEKPLSVELLDFSVVLDKNQLPQISWRVGIETEVSHYIIQRSKDAKNWSDIAEQPALGRPNYQVFDAALNSIQSNEKILYYRLRVVDLDGSFEHSPIRRVQFLSSTEQLLVYPNPTEDAIFFNGNWKANTTLQWQIISVEGQIIQQQQNRTSNTPLSVDLTKLSAGLYYLRVQTESQTWLEKVVKL